MPDIMNPEGYPDPDPRPGGDRPEASLLDNIRRVGRLLGEIERDLRRLPFGPTGEPTFPEPHRDARLSLYLDAIRDSLPSLFGRSGIRIAGVEMTQSIQFFNLNDGGSGAGADNAVPLIANKDLVLRVYVEIRPFATDYVPASVTGRVRVAGQEFDPLIGPNMMRQVPPRDGQALRREFLWHSLNFRIPAALCHGRRVFRIHVYDVNSHPFASVGIRADGTAMPYSSATEEIEARFRDVPRMRVVGIMVNYTGPDRAGTAQNLPAPIGTSLIDTLARFRSMFPIQGFDFGPCVQLSWGQSLGKIAGEDEEGWGPLLNHIATIRRASWPRCFHIGLLPAGLSMTLGTTQRGIGGVGVAIAAQDDTRALSHELGHAAGFDHVAVCGAPGDVDPNYPKYRDGTYPFGSIGEFGLDTERMVLFDPAVAQDFMGYCDIANVPFPARTWISPYHYLRMREAIEFTDGGGFDAVIKVTIPAIQAMVLNFRLHRDGHIELLPSYRVTGVPTDDPGRHAMPVMLDLLGRDGAILSSHRCHRHNPYQDPDAPYVDFHEVVPWPDGVKRIAVARKGEPAQTIEVGGRAPKLRLGKLRRVRRGGDLARLEWRADSPGGPALAMIRYSNDDGLTWQAIAADVAGSDHLVNLDLLPGGRRCRLEVILASGLRGAAARTEPFTVAPKKRSAYLVSPCDGDTFRQGTAITLIGGGYSPDGGVCPADEVAWHSNIEGLLGTGYQVAGDRLRPGTHRITLSLPDGEGGEAATSVHIKIVERGEAADECPPLTEPPPTC